MRMKWPLLVGLLGCAPDSDYALDIDPVTPGNLSMSLGQPDVTLVHREAAGPTTLYPLGPLADGDFGDLPPLLDGTIGLLLTRSGTASDTYVPADLIGYGEAPLGGPLGTGREERTVRMLITEFAGTGDLGSVPRRRAPLMGAAVLLPSGSAYLFGGQRDGISHDSIQRIVDIRSGDWEVEELDGMPSSSVLHTATALDDGTILVTGGRPAYFSISDNSSAAFIYDPQSSSVVWEAVNGMNRGRSRHQAIKLRSGRVLVFGGWQGSGVDSLEGTFQIFDPDQRRFVDSGTAAASSLGTNLTAYGGEGAVVCGGFSFDFDTERLVASAACERISLSGDLIPFPDLPEAMGVAAMAALPDGRILLAGGVIGDIQIPFENGFLAGANVGQATDRAWLYEPGPNAWREVSPLSTARAGAVAVPSGDGRIVIIGGATQVGAMIAEDTGPVFCSEVFDPASDSFASPGSCSTPGSGAFPPVSTQPGLGTLVVEGHLAPDGAESGGQAYGIIGLAPNF